MGWKLELYDMKVGFGSKPGLGCGTGACSKSSTAAPGAKAAVDGLGFDDKLPGNRY